MIEYRLWGENASLFKLVNIGFHLVNSYLIVLLAYKILNILYPASLRTSDDEDKRRWIASFFAGTLLRYTPPACRIRRLDLRIERPVVGNVLFHSPHRLCKLSSVRT